MNKLFHLLIFFFIGGNIYAQGTSAPKYLRDANIAFESGKYFVRTHRGEDSPLSPGTTYTEVLRVPEGMVVIREKVPTFYTKTIDDYRAATQEANILLAIDVLSLDAHESKVAGDNNDNCFDLLL